jgi:ribosomal protein S18 acetylase RimI-like enzyme
MNKIGKIKKEDRVALAEFLQFYGTHYHQKDPLFYYPGVNLDLAEELLVYNGEVFLAEAEKNIVGVIAFQKRDWDTEHFGYSVASIDHLYVQDRLVTENLLVEFSHWAKEEKIIFVSIKTFSKPEITAALEKAGFYFIEEDSYLSKKLPDEKLSSINSELPAGFKLRDFQPSDLNELLRIISATEWSNRFHNDLKINKEKANEVYTNWVKNGMAKPNSHATILESNGKIAGFILWSTQQLKQGLVGDQEMVAMAPEFRGQGLGKFLYGGCVKQMQDAGCVIVWTVVNSQNITAIKNLKKSGLSVSYKVAVYHWFRN